MKRLIEADSVQSPKRRRRRQLTIEEKLQILERLDAGQCKATLCRTYDISESAVRSLQCSAEKLRRYAANCPADALKSSAYIPRNATVELTERLLYEWYVEVRAVRSHQHHQGSAFTIAEICAKGREIYAGLISEEAAHTTDEIGDDGESRKFKASKGWFTKFRKHYNIDFHAPLDGRTGTPDDARPAAYAMQFQATLRAADYAPQQVFSAIELTLPWRSLPATRPAATGALAQRFSASDRDRLSLLLCANASGEFVVKPLLIHRTLRPYCMRSFDVGDLPVFWRARAPDTQSRPRLTPKLLEEWLQLCFAPAVRDYLQIMELPERCLLLLEAVALSDATATTASVAAATHFVQFEILSEQRAGLQPPLLRHVVPMFRCIYLRRLLAQLRQTIERQTQNTNFVRAWRNFTVAESIELIAASLEEISADCWNSGWMQLWPEIVNTERSTLSEEMQRVVDVGRGLPAPGYAQLTIESIKSHLKFADDRVSTPPPTDEQQLDDVVNSANDELEQQALPATAPFAPAITTAAATTATTTRKCAIADDVRAINKALVLASELIASVQQVRGGAVDHARFDSQLQACLQPYKELKRRLLQPSIRDYLRPQNKRADCL